MVDEAAKGVPMALRMDEDFKSKIVHNDCSM